MMQEYGSDSRSDPIPELENSPGFDPRSLVFFNVPLPDGSVLKFSIVREDNPEVVLALPQRNTYTVRCRMPLLGPEGMIRGTHGNAQVKDISVFKTFTSRTAALDFARTKFTRLQGIGDDPILHVPTMSPDHPMLPGVVGIIERALAGAQCYDQVVELRKNEPRA